MKTIQCPICGEGVLNGSYDHEFIIEGDEVVCSGSKKWK